ncbi:MAG TPA: aspartate kinase, partial [Bryobacteraceae bacterium]|nr:aspartate kinase [Bryobacteraceae bacterium]
MNDLLVMKFGGTSMGSADRIRVAAQICSEQRQHRPVVAVVSAMSKVTDLLLDTLRLAESGNEPEMERDLASLVSRHLDACHALFSGDALSEALADVYELVDQFRRIAEGVLMLGERPPKSVDEAISVGERLSAAILARYLHSEGVRAKALNASKVIVTDACFGDANPLMARTRAKACAALTPLLEEGVLPVVTGFNGATEDGRPTTLGRGGSDYSASILAAALDASELWIWTDVDGIMSADPRLVSSAVVLPAVTYNEAAELAYAGAKVLHPRTLLPLVEKQIPVWSKNSFNLQAPGTRIVSKTDSRPGPRAVTSMSKVVLIAVEAAKSVLSGTQVMARTMNALARAGSEVLAFSSSSYRQNFCFLVREDECEEALQNINAELALELAHG